jgi:hypothetical protein
MKIGERKLLPAMRAASKHTLIITEGFSCRKQIADATGREALHLAAGAAMAIGGALLAGLAWQPIRIAGRSMAAHADRKHHGEGDPNWSRAARRARSDGPTAPSREDRLLRASRGEGGDEAEEVVDVQHRRCCGSIAVGVVIQLLSMRKHARRGELGDEADEVIDVQHWRCR